MRATATRDTLLLVVDPRGRPATPERAPASASAPTLAGVLGELERVIAGRAQRPEAPNGPLLAKGLDHTLKKIGEEATEVVLAAKGESDERLAEESADLVYHLMVVLDQRRVPLAPCSRCCGAAGAREGAGLRAVRAAVERRRLVPVFREIPATS